MKIHVLTRLIASALLTFSATTYAAIPAPGTPLPVDNAIKIGKLDNGLSYYILKNGKPEHRVELRLVVKAGSILEDADQQGLAHFTEHMAFDGSAHFKKHELISYLQSIGVQFGADLNAYTSFDETIYILPIPTDKPENLETGFQVLEDWAHGVSMDDQAIEQERPVILEETRIGKGANDRILRKLLPELFNGSKYAQRLPIGKEDIIQHFKPDALRRFYHDWYRPDLMAVVAVGDIEPEAVEKLIRAHFSNIKNPARERKRDYVTIQNRKDSLGLLITDKEATNKAVLIRYPVEPAKLELTLADYRRSILRGLYSNMLNQRLHDLTQQANPPFQSASSGKDTPATGYESYQLVVVPGPAGVETAIAAAVQENERARQFGFTSEELERAKKNDLRNMEVADAERDKTNSANHAAELIRNFLTREPIPGIHTELVYHQEMLPTITLDEINAFAKSEIPVNAPKLVTYIGSSKEGEVTPTEQQLLTWVETAEKTPLVAREEHKVSRSLMATPPEPGKIVAEKPLTAIGATEWTLSNGLHVLLKPTDFKNDQILLGAARFGGHSLSEDNDLLDSRYAATIVQSMGLAEFSPNDLSKILAGKSFAVQLNSSAYADHVSMRSSVADLESALQYLTLRLTSPRMDADLFQTQVNNAKESTRNALARPEAQFSDATQDTLYNHNPRLQLVLNARPEDFDKLKVERSLELFQKHFHSVKDMTFVIVGSFELDKIKPLVERYLANLPVEETPSQYKDRGERPIRGVVKKEVHAGSEPKATLNFIFTGPMDYSPEEQVRVHLMLGVMNQRIVDVLREQKSLIYAGNIGGVLERVPYQGYRIVANLPCSPENIDKVSAALFEEIEKLQKEGPQTADLEKVKQQNLKSLDIALKTNEYWFGALQEGTLYHDELDGPLKAEQRIKQTSAEDIRKAAARYLDSKNYLQMVLLPETK